MRRRVKATLAGAEVKDTMMADHDSRYLVEMLAVPWPSEPPPCPLCGRAHALEEPCADGGRKRAGGRHPERAGRRPRGG